MIANPKNYKAVSGEFLDHDGERFYVINNSDKIPAFFVTVVSDSDHWLFASSNGGLSAGRVSPETALFPYVTVDKITDSVEHTGCKTILKVYRDERNYEWEPFNREHDGLFNVSRNLYKNTLGNKLCFEETNHDLQLLFRYTWSTSDEYGFVRKCELENLSEQGVSLDMLDGLQNILPAGTPRFVQTNSSNLVDAYKWSELDERSGVAFFALYSGITDRAEPCESLKANTVFCLGLAGHKILISSEQLEKFRLNQPIVQEVNRRGLRGAYFVNDTIHLEPLASKRWQLVVNNEQTQQQVISLCSQLAHPDHLEKSIRQSIEKGSDELADIMAGGDGFQCTAQENVSVHHYANVLFNILRGGSFDDQYQISARDFSSTIALFNQKVYQRNKKLLEALEPSLNLKDLESLVDKQGDPSLQRLFSEYLPITFGRRHGDPSRPWNQFAIKLKDEQGNRILSYQGNWRDIFQNWEALSISYPEFVENMIAKFVNASTVEGYNPYRITKEGIDWEVEDEDDPWSFIGYWGDHQIIYLLKLLELSVNFHPSRLRLLLRRNLYCYANVPYRIKPFEALLKDPKNTVEFDEEKADLIEQRVSTLGADGKLVLDENGEVYQVNLLEKLLVPLLCKLSNLVIDGGIWLNTQRPEWNDANNALVGQGLSMVTLYYLRRYVRFLQNILNDEAEVITLSTEVSLWLKETATALSNVKPLLIDKSISAELRLKTLVELGEASGRYREVAYQPIAFSGTVSQDIGPVKSLLEDALIAIDHSIESNQRQDGMYHAYNILQIKQSSLTVDTLYPMLEGQVAALSSGAIKPQQALEILKALFDSALFREDQQSFLLYPDRELSGFLEKNRIPSAEIAVIPLLGEMLEKKDHSIVLLDAEYNYRFNAEIINSNELKARLNALTDAYGEKIESAKAPLLALYETVFNHKEFTGRSGGMFGFEGLGSIYWHMVSKLLLAVQEVFFAAVDQNDDVDTIRQLADYYYRVRQGIGFNKTPSEYGAFPTDPYSHTPKHAGAQQPGMTGQVKEELLTRFGELGVRVNGGTVHFQPALLRASEFISRPRQFRYLDVSDVWQEITVPANGLAFTWCQVPIIYQLFESADSSLTIIRNDGMRQVQNQLVLSAEDSAQLFMRSGEITKIKLVLDSGQFFSSDNSRSNNLQSDE